MAYFIYVSDTDELIVTANTKSLGSKFGGPAYISRWYLHNTNRDLSSGSEEGNASYLGIVLSIAEDAQNNNDYVHLEQVLRFAKYLISRGQDVNYDKYLGMSLLHYYAFTNNIELVEFLLKNYADKELKANGTKDFKGMTALEIALFQHSKKGNYSKMIQLLN